MATFYRVHWTELGDLTAANAWSSLTGIDRKPGDLSKSECQMCDASEGEWTECRHCEALGCDKCDGQGGSTTCTNCDGTGWEDCIRGYSCYSTPESLITYYAESGRSGMVPDAERVIIFEGWQTDTGFDDEPTAVPEQIIETLTWAEFRARYEEDAA
ncbi:hypothetical protein HY68_36845 [Streptomyces sp. AcH 505]|uniref:hypothetical protein n=1 Tax=Streptomyces sp. AcH 505 TaxID=352211 RepID=UPI000591A7BC|nr:hypothetical protein HY68_36845 [Streptomyces sp. AcH 505]